MLVLTAFNAQGSTDVELVEDFVPYINLQWNRKLFAAGNFEVTLAAKDYYANYQAFMVSAEDEEEFYKIGSEGLASISKLRKHYEVGLVLKKTISLQNGERVVTLSGLMADALLDGAIITISPNYSSNVSVHSFIQGIWPGKPNYYASTGSVITNVGAYGVSGSFLYTYGRSETYASDYKPQFSACSFKHMRTVLENRSSGLAVGVHTNTGTESRNHLCFFIKRGDDKSGSIVIGADEGTSATEVISEDSSSGYYGTVIRFSNKDLGTSAGFETIVRSPSPNAELPIRAQWDMGFRFVDEQSANNNDETVNVFKARRSAEEKTALQDYGATSDISVDVSLMGRDTIKTIGLGDWVSVHIAVTDTYYKAQVVEIHETVKAQSHTTELVLGSKRLTNIQRAKLY